MKYNQTAFGYLRTSLLLTVALIAGVSIMDSATAFGRAGGGRSMGRGSSFGGSRRSAPPPMQRAAPPQQGPGAQPAPAPGRQQAPQSPPPSAPSGGGFLRNMAGGIAGGFLGSMLFSSMGQGAGMGGSGMGGSGLGLFDMLMLGGIAYFGFRWWKSRQQSIMTPSYGSGMPSAPPLIFDETPTPGQSQPLVPSSLRVESDLDTDTAGDIFFRIQGAWTRRDLSIVANIMEDEILSTLNLDVMRLKEEKHINRLENISIRAIELRDAWTELGCELATMRIVANLLDYTVEEGTERLIEGSDNVPVKFQEDWTFRRNHGSITWKLAGIAQV